MRRFRERPLYCYIGMTIGVGVAIFGFNFFLLPQQIAPGGFSGIAALLYYLLKIPVGITVLALNIPVFLLALKSLGRQFAVRSLYALILYAVLADVLPVLDLSGDRMIAAVYGGILMGAGLGLTLYFGGSTGGSDLVAKLVNGRFRNISVSACIFAIDCAVILASAAVFDLQAGLVALIALYLSAKVLEMLTEGAGRARAFLIISEKYAEIERSILRDLGRGSTELRAVGAYTGREAVALLCVVQSRLEFVRLKDIVQHADSHAFLISWVANEVNGLGFE